MILSSIRFRLAAWYFLSLAAILVVFVLGARFAMRQSVFEAIDEDLRARIRGVGQFLNRQIGEGPGALTDEFDEYAMLGSGGGLLQVSDETGNVLYRSARLRDYPLRKALRNTRIEYAIQRANGSALRIASQTIAVRGKPFTIQVAEPLHEFEESIERFQNILLISGPLLLVIASLGGFWMSGRALAPVDRITHDARQINMSNISGRLAVPPAKDELQRLTQTLNEMLDRIDTSVRRMVQFTADASHELRAPLTLIHTAAEFSLRRDRTNEELLDAMRKIVRESARTSKLVDGLLVLARADSGTDDLRLSPTDLSVVASHAYEQVRTLAEPRHIDVSLSLPERPVMVQGDEQALGRLFLILLDNAVKYTPEGGRIAFRLRVVGSRAEATVSDNGIGISPADLPHIFERFWRADKVRSRNAGGAGLGLSIARWIVTRHEGEIEAGSQPGEGSQFTVRLPLH